MAEVKGILGRKIGMTQVFDEDGHAVPVTVRRSGALPRRPDEDAGDGRLHGRPAGVRRGEADRTSPWPVTTRKAGIDTSAPSRRAAARRASASTRSGSEIKADVFETGEIVDVIGVTKGKGFAGAMKRHNFKGLGCVHGTQKKHR